MAGVDAYFQSVFPQYRFFLSFKKACAVMCIEAQPSRHALEGTMESRAKGKTKALCNFM